MTESRPFKSKLMYYKGDVDVPILIRLNIPPDQMTLSQFKSTINLRPSNEYKYYFKTEVDNYIVKEEIVDDDSKLPVFNGDIVCYIEGVDGSDRSGCAGQRSGSSSHSRSRSSRSYSNKSFNHHTHSPSQSHHHRLCEGNYSDDDDTSSRISTSTNETSVSRYIPRPQVRTKRYRNKRSASNASSVSSVTDASSISRYLRTVYFNLDSANQLGISINQITSNNQNGGICVGSIMKGGVVDVEGTIKPGDLILQVNDHVLSNMTSDEVVEILREATIRPGTIKFVIAKNLDANPETYFSPREDPVQPLNMAAWVAQTEAATRLNGHIEPNEPNGVPSSESASTSASHSSMPSSYTRSEQRQLIPAAPELRLNYSSMFDIVRHAACPGSGLTVKDRKWLKIIIPNAFLGRDLVNWLFTHVRGFDRRREAYNFAKQLMKNNHIKHTVNKKFSENCYYEFDQSVYNEPSNENLAAYSQLSFNMN